MALGTSARPSTIATTKACRAGVSKALIIPWSTCRPMISPTVMTPANVSTASASDWRSDSTCVTRSTLRRSHRSTNTPVTGARKSVGTCPANPTTPRRRSDPVRRYTIQLVAIRVIQVPTRETLWPLKKSR